MVLKMLAMSTLTALQRFKKKVCCAIFLVFSYLAKLIPLKAFVNPEDTLTFKNLKPKV